MYLAIWLFSYLVSQEKCSIEPCMGVHLISCLGYTPHVFYTFSFMMYFFCLRCGQL